MCGLSHYMWGISNYMSLHDIICHYMWHTQHAVAIEHHCDSDVVEMMQPRESKLRLTQHSYMHIIEACHSVKWRMMH